MLRNENVERNSTFPNTHTQTQLTSNAQRVLVTHDYKCSVFILTIFTKIIVNLKYCFNYAT